VENLAYRQTGDHLSGMTPKTRIFWKLGTSWQHRYRSKFHILYHLGLESLAWPSLMILTILSW